MAESTEAKVPVFQATIDYEVIDRNPLVLVQGQVVRVGPRDPEWEGWIWVTADDGRGSHVPEEICQQAGSDTGVITRDFQARDLSVSSGDRVTSVDEVNGWRWCRREDGAEGWLPSYILDRE